MKNLNEAQMIIFEEESGRALMLKKAKETLNESEYNGLVELLPEYEKKADELGISRLELYEGFWDTIKSAASDIGKIGTGILGGLAGKAQNFKDRNMSAGAIRKELEAILSDRDTRILFDQVKNPQSYISGGMSQDDIEEARIKAEFVILNIKQLFNRLGALDPLQKAEQEAEALARIAGTLGMEPRELLTQYNQGSETAQQRGANNPRNTRLQRAYNAARQRVDIPRGEEQPAPAEEPQAPESGEEAPDAPQPTPSSPEPEEAPNTPEPEEDKAKDRELEVDDIRRRIRSVVDDVLDNIKIRDITGKEKEANLSGQQEREIISTITKNLINQLRVNGVEFKNVDGELKESFVKALKDVLKEETLFNKLKLSKQFYSKKDVAEDFGGEQNGALDFASYSEFYDAAVDKFQKMGLKENPRKLFKQLQGSDDPKTYVDFYEMFMDIRKLKILNAGTRVYASNKEKNRLKEMKNKIRKLYKYFTDYTDFAQKEEGEEYEKKYKSLKRSIVGTKGDKQRIAGDEKRRKERIAKGKIDKPVDDSLAKPTKGRINISQTVAKAIKKSGADQDTAKALTPVLTKKIKKIVSQYTDSDVKYLEEKINRYVGAVLKEIK